MEEEYQYELKITKDRIAVLIGKDGSTKKQLEQATGVKIQVDSKEGDVYLSSNDAMKLYTTREIVKAIGRGFNPEFALLLLKPDYSLEIFNIADYAGNKHNTIARIKGRIIGSGGKSRKTIENLTETNISVYGKTICIIGESTKVAIARKAIQSLLTGAPHSGVYRWLEKKRREFRQTDLLGKDI